MNTKAMLYTCHKLFIIKTKRSVTILQDILFLPLLTRYAAGSATAGYALKAREADYLSA